MKTKAIALFFCLMIISGNGYAIDIPLIKSSIQISVSITGYVDRPGTYQINSPSRLSEALENAKPLMQPQSGATQVIPEHSIDPYYFTLKSVEKEEEIEGLKNQALRSVTIIREGNSSHYDLQKFYCGGDLSQNPVIKDGDIIHVKAISKVVSIQGSVFKPGEYEYLKGDKLKDLLILAQGFKPEADLKSILIYRYKENKVDFDVYCLDLSSYEQDASLLEYGLEETDRIMVPTNSQFRRSWNVQIEGKINAPGEYLIDKETRLYDLLVLAGGPADNADLVNSIIVNRTLTEKIDPDFERLKSMSITMVTPMEYNYLRAKLRQITGKYSLNLQQCWDSKGEKSNPLLNDGDLIFIPAKLEMVWVSGQVKNPGLVPWVEGKNYVYYVEQAGGYTNNRKFLGTRIIRHSSGNWVKPTKKLSIRPGDTVFVAEKTDRDFWLDVKDVALLTTQLLTIIIGLRTVSNY